MSLCAARAIYLFKGAGLCEYYMLYIFYVFLLHNTVVALKNRPVQASHSVSWSSRIASAQN